MEKVKKSNITVNWRGKANKRGLTETVIKTLVDTGNKTKKDVFLKRAEALQDEYEVLKNKKDPKTNCSWYSFDKEVELCGKYVNVRV